uniref:Thioredoxin n=1 Tax=Nothobranchius korthausae TaxID=1143690 RepID=A0A1A8GXU6_9TELE
MVQQIKNKAEFDTLLSKAGNKLVVVDFTATWCGPCRRIAPLFEKLANEHADVIFVKVDVDDAADVSGACGIRCMPTFQFYKNGEKVHEFSGADEKKLEEKVKELK